MPFPTSMSLPVCGDTDTPNPKPQAANPREKWPAAIVHRLRQNQCPHHTRASPAISTPTQNALMKVKLSTLNTSIYLRREPDPLDAFMSGMEAQLSQARKGWSKGHAVCAPRSALLCYVQPSDSKEKTKWWWWWWWWWWWCCRRRSGWRKSRRVSKFCKVATHGACHAHTVVYLTPERPQKLQPKP